MSKPKATWRSSLHSFNALMAAYELLRAVQVYPSQNAAAEARGVSKAHMSMKLRALGLSFRCTILVPGRNPAVLTRDAMELLTYLGEYHAKVRRIADRCGEWQERRLAAADAPAVEVEPAPAEVDRLGRIEAQLAQLTEQLQHRTSPARVAAEMVAPGVAKTDDGRVVVLDGAGEGEAS